METIRYKKNLLERLLDLVSEKESSAKENSEKAQNRANEEEGAMHSRYSTFKEEGQYVAGGLKILHMNFESALSIVRSLLNETIRENDMIESLSIVEIEFEDEAKITKIFVFPALGGEKIDDMIIITPASPLGKVLMKKNAGDEFILTIGKKTRRGEIISVK